MAFATSNVARENMGTVNVFRGSWSSSIGDTPGIVSIGGTVSSAEFYENTSSGAYQSPVPVSWSQSGSTTTVTVYHQGTVTAGSFVIRFKG